MQLSLPSNIPVRHQSAVVDRGGGEFIQDIHPRFCSFLYSVVGIFIYPMLKLIDGGDPWEDGDHAFKMMSFRTFEILFICEEYMPVIHGEKLHSHAGYFGHFCGIFLESIQCQRMGKE